MKLVLGYLRSLASVLMLCLVLMAGFSASMNMLLTHDVVPDMEAADHQAEHGDHHHDFALADLDIPETNTALHKHIHNAADHSHDTPVTLQRKPIEVFQKVAKVTIFIPYVPETNMFYGLDRPPAVG